MNGVIMCERPLTIDQVARIRERWKHTYGTGAKVAILEPGMKFVPERQFEASVLRLAHEDRYCLDPHPLPIPFRWGPNGSLILLGILLSPIALAVIGALLSRG